MSLQSVLNARLTARPASRRELAQALIDWAAAARLGSGCLSARVYEDVEASGSFGLVAEWESRERLDAHLGSDRFAVLMGAVEMLAQPPVAAFTRTDEASAVAIPREKPERGAGQA